MQLQRQLSSMPMSRPIDPHPLIACLLAAMWALATVSPDAYAQSTPPVMRLPLVDAALANTLVNAVPAANSTGGPSQTMLVAPNNARAPLPLPRLLEVPEVPPPEPSEFERLATTANDGKPVWRLGSQARRVEGLAGERETAARVPPHYVVQVGDEVSISTWGSVDAQWQLRVDRAGRITLPRVGPVPLAGATAAEIEGRVRTRLNQVFKSFEVSAAVTDVSAMRVHITGFVERPGDYVVPGLSTISSALANAQGPSAGGSYRRIRLLRDDKPVVVFDLYGLLREGQRRDDRLLHPGDVLYVEPVGPQAAVLGSVNRPAVFEFLPGETVADVLRLAGGFSSVAERSTVVLERLRERSGQGAVALALPIEEGKALSDGDILRVRSQVLASVPSQTRNKRVLVEGEVRQPGEYLLPATATLQDALAAAGGPTPAAFLFGASLRRESVRVNQEVNYDRALRELETELTRNAANRATRVENAVDADASVQRLISRLRMRRPEGRMVLDINPGTPALPALPLEDGDRIQLPTSNQSVGVFGSVFNAGSFVLSDGRSLGHYIQRAGGPTGGADYSSAFVVRANGSVMSASHSGSFWARTSRFESEPALAGDTVFVPEELFRGSFVQGAKDWTQILYQLGVGLAALRTVR